MAAAQRHWAADLLHFWFHTLGPADWFGQNDDVDAELERRFGRLLIALGGQKPGCFLTDPDCARAAILLFDQCPRNLFRNSPKAFAYDPLALAICKAALEKGWDIGLSKAGKQFLYIPLMHSEDIRDQRLSMRLFTALGDSKVRDFALAHFEVIARHGRYPHRNAALGRITSPAEQRSLDAGFGW